MANNQAALFCSPTGFNSVRETDAYGKGYFGAPRGPRLHRGVDLNIEPGAEVFSPIFGKVVRITAPYKSDDRFKGVVIDGLGPYTGFSVKLFYLNPKQELIGRAVQRGDVLGYAQDLTIKYKGISNHVHFEATLNGTQIDPSRFLEKEEMCKP